MKKLLLQILISIAVFFSLAPMFKVSAYDEYKVGVYFGGIGCPHCAIVSPVLHKKVEEENFIIVDYEIYKKSSNAFLLSQYSDTYSTGLGIPLLVFNKDNQNSGDSPIKDNWDSMFSKAEANKVPMAYGSLVSIEDLNLNELERYPSIFNKDRVATRKEWKSVSEEENNMIKRFIFTKDINEAIKDLRGEKASIEKIELSGGSKAYQNAIKINGWLLQWNGDSISTENTSSSSSTTSTEAQSLTLGKTILLALADSVNPCAISVLALMLIAIVTYNPGNRKQVLFSGLAFILAVAITYMFYGFLIIKAFEVISAITSIRDVLQKIGINTILGFLAIGLGALEIFDFVYYKPGRLGTEMPIFLRPQVQKFTAKATSPTSAFFLGLFVTIFLLPCTIGPYVILGGSIASDGFLRSIPTLLLYNLIFVSPMIVIVFLIFFGTKQIKDITNWKDKNVRKLHLIAGLLLAAVGVSLILGLLSAI